MPGIRFCAALLFFVIIAMFSINIEASEIPAYELHVTILPDEHLLIGKARITVPENVKPHFLTGELEIRRLTINGAEHKPGNDALNKLKTGEGETTIEIDYSVTFEPVEEKTDIENIGDAGINMIDQSGIILLSNWYPFLKNLAIYKLTAEMPPDFEALSESESSVEKTEGDIKTVAFDFPHPSSGITLVAGKYNIHEDTYGDVTIRTLFLRDDRELATLYLNKTKEYIELYESMVGAFPYKRFSIVENDFQTGYSFPTYTLLGSRVIQLPFIPETSLGHEILHQWFGNHVYVDYNTGNWAEGLTTYLSDHWFEDMTGEGANHRKKILMDYMNYVTPEKEISLREFAGREDFSTKAVGYGKAAMVFHMLRKRLGDDTFFGKIQSFVDTFKYRDTTWDDLIMSFNPSGEENLDAFFSQWLERKGIPFLHIRNSNSVFRDGNYVLVTDIAQRGEPYNLYLRGKVITTEEEEEFIIEINKKDTHFEKSLSARPLTVVFDEGYDILRTLQFPEKPPVISAFTGNKKSVAIVPEGESDLYGDISELLKEQGFMVKNENEIKNKDIVHNSVLIMSGNNRIYRRLFAGRQLHAGGLVIQVEHNPLNPSRAAVVVSAQNKEELKAFRKMFRYGNYSLLVFEGSTNIKKETNTSDMGIVLDLSIEPEAVETKNNLGLEDVIKKIQDRRVIFVGELHTMYSHHVMQYEIIKRLHERNGNLVIGMEMFQKPFQEYLDHYSNGDIDETAFLKKTEYFKRWKFDYNLYRDILQYSRHNGIPVIALNLKREIVEKVSREGIDALSDKERVEIPADIDMTNREYRKSMKEVFHRHATRGKKSFENFFQSQILWDETMAHNTVEALRKYPDSQMVVLAGNGHLQYAWGIPDRVRRLSGESTAIILNSGGGSITKDLADFVLYPPTLQTPESPKLGAFLNDNEGRVEILKVIPNTPASKGELRNGDIIISIDNTSIKDISDIKIKLLDHKKGDSVKVTIKRPRFLFGPKDMEVTLML